MMNKTKKRTVPGKGKREREHREKKRSSGAQGGYIEKDTLSGLRE
jgi:hypothetical protein